MNENVNTYRFVPYGLEASNLLSHLGMPETPDNMICACASVVMDTEDGELEFVTGDLCCRLLGKNVFGLTVSESKNDEENIYKGYKVISGTTDEINQAMELIYSSQFNGWNVNEYLLIQNSDDGSEKEMRFDGNGFVSLRLPPSKFIK